LESSGGAEHRGSTLMQPVARLAGQHCGCHHGREPYLGTEHRRHASESIGRNTYDREFAAVERDRPADDIRAAAEAALPEIVRDDDGWVSPRRAIFVRKEESPGRGPDAENAEIVAGHQLSEDALRRAACRQAESERR